MKPPHAAPAHGSGSRGPAPRRGLRWALPALLLAGCSGADVPLENSPLVAAAPSAAFPREPLGSLPVAPDERTFDERCGIEAAVGATVTDMRPDNSIVVDLPASFSGWAFAPDGLPQIPEAWLRMVPVDPANPAAQFPLVLHFPRPDVVAARSAPQAAYSGFTQVTVTDLPPGDYDAQVVFVAGTERWVCSNARRVRVP